jgi:3-(methylthio)propionyl---CoA ligase
MHGLMQQRGLLISNIIEFASVYHADTEIVSRRVEGDIHRTNYAQAARRAKQVANALDAWKLPQSARVATLAWNGYRHFELYYGVSGSGRVLHTVNPRLHPDQMAWIVNHAEDDVMCFDMTFLPLIKAIAPKCPTVKRYVALCDEAALPADSGIPNLVSYERWIGDQATTYAWPQFDENLASSLCYTSGTTGHPKGVLYSHRSTLLHAMASASVDSIGISGRDTVLPVVPMFHVNAWGLPYLMPMIGESRVPRRCARWQIDLRVVRS